MKGRLTQKNEFVLDINNRESIKALNDVLLHETNIIKFIKDIYADHYKFVKSMIENHKPK